MRVESDWRAFSDINVTPFIDIMLVLLVIFMISAPLLNQQGISVVLPKAKTGQETGTAALVITLTREHVTYLGDTPVTFAELRQRLDSAERNQTVLIRADESAYVKKLMELWDTCRDFGFTRVYVSTTAD